MGQPLKRTAFSQGIHEVSSVKKEQIGILRILQDGRAFRYAKAGSSALSAGKLTVAAAVAAAVTNKACPAASVGTKQLTLTIGTATYAENFFAGGYLQINDEDGEGYQYLIESSTAVSNGTSIVVTLAEGIKKALTTSSKFTLVHSPWIGTEHSATQARIPAGIPPVDVPANYYYWSQVAGVGIGLIAGTPAVGSKLTIGTPAGAMKVLAGASNEICPTVAEIVATGVDGQYKPVKLLLE